MLEHFKDLFVHISLELPITIPQLLTIYVILFLTINLLFIVSLATQLSFHGKKIT